MLANTTPIGAEAAIPPVVEELIGRLKRAVQASAEIERRLGRLEGDRRSRRDDALNRRLERLRHGQQCARNRVQALRMALRG
ncbi:MAG: hypothetical protein HUU25_11400 [Candidatus Sumerlaeia bacterium]|nr:hypothetical protein [Candidatus Sumerlaeia bacterium]